MSSPGNRQGTHARRLRFGALSLLATTGLLGTYLGYPGLRRAYAAVNCGSIYDEASLVSEINRMNAGGCDTLNIPAMDIILTSDLPQVTRSGNFTINGSTSGSTTIAGQDSHSAFYFKNATTVTVTSLTVLDTYSDTHAAGLFAGGNVTLTGVTFTNNEADNDEGGAVSVGESIVINDSTFTSNSAGDRGGAVSAFRSATVTNSTFTLNTSADDGGAIFAGAESTITNSIFENNRATNEGGALFLDGSSTVTGTRFTSNRAGTTNVGGAIYSDGTNLTVSDCSFTTNAARSGGAIYAKNNAAVSASTFATNDATQVGGAVYVKANATITGSTFTGNDADQGGGAVRAYGPASIVESLFIGNTAVSRGGAVFAGYPASVTDSTFTNNYSTSGGGIDSQTAITVQSSTFSGNLAALRGGAIYSVLDQEILYSTFEANTANVGGGALSNSTSSPAGAALDITNSTFNQNEAPSFGAISWNGDAAINFSTIAGNEFQSSTAALRVTDTLAISNSIVYGNIDQTSRVAIDFVATGRVTSSHSLFTSNSSFSAPPGSTFTNTLYGDPRLGPLTDNGGPTLTMLPAANSPVIGMADPTGAPAFDQRGYTRTTNGYADMGSVERGGRRPAPDPSQAPPAWFQATTRNEETDPCPANMHPSWAQWPNDNTGGWTCEWSTWWDINKGNQGGWATTPGFNPGRPVNQ
ncbi:MAG TPA: choice-of-anchor Q domain-containing protein [Candidatus Nanopelagicales bacterium]|nr:choice-of-anchor Q domain-containing protein [Candidatus Nanopelagicales bacterium]